jgi:hypothetical protein
VRTFLTCEDRPRPSHGPTAHVHRQRCHLLWRDMCANGQATRSHGQPVCLLCLVPRLECHWTTSSMNSIPCRVPGCGGTYKLAHHLGMPRREVHPELYTTKPLARPSSQPKREARRQVTGPYPLPATRVPLRRVLKHVPPMPPRAADAPAAATPPSTKPFRSNMEAVATGHSPWLRRGGSIVSPNRICPHLRGWTTGSRRMSGLSRTTASRRLSCHPSARWRLTTGRRAR